MLNKIIVMGRLGRDPEVRYTSTGKPVVYPDVVRAEEITGGPRGDDGYGSTGR